MIQLKERIASQSAVPFARQKLICAGKVVGGTSQLDAKTLEQAGLKENALIMVHQTAADSVIAVQLAPERVTESVDQVEKTAAALANRQSGGSRSRERCVDAPSAASLMRLLCDVRIATWAQRHAICLAVQLFHHVMCSARWHAWLLVCALRGSLAGTS